MSNTQMLLKNKARDRSSLSRTSKGPQEVNICWRSIDTQNPSRNRPFLNLLAVKTPPTSGNQNQQQLLGGLNRQEISNPVYRFLAT
jgi:hypothetical protein